ncbi:hypothetical protein MRX96_054640 [Rhipicephalus microplus]
MHNAEKFLDKMTSNSTDDNMRTLSKNSSAQALIAPPMHQSRARSASSLPSSKKLIRRVIGDLPDLSFSYKRFSHTCKYMLNSGTSDKERGCVESTYEGEYVITVAHIVRCIVLYFIPQLHQDACLCLYELEQASETSWSLH